MRVSFIATSALVALATTVSAHTIMQKISVNGADQGQLVGVRSPDSNYPILDVKSASLSCNANFHSPVSSTIITVPAGAKVGTWWGHVIGGPQVANDPDNPIAASHHGPMIYYLAKVSNAATASTSGNQWFKIAQDGLENGVWGIDRMVSGGGWTYFTLPSCVAPGNYLLRAEALALHSAGTSGQAQFYVECAQINVTGSGTWTGSNFISLPGAYSASDPGILINIYGSGGQPNNGGKAYTPPGGAVQTCSSSGGGSTGGGSTGGGSTGGGSTTTAPLYGQCGGTGWTGATTCASGKCTVSSQYYSQCLP